MLLIVSFVCFFGHNKELKKTQNIEYANYCELLVVPILYFHKSSTGLSNALHNDPDLYKSSWEEQAIWFWSLINVTLK